VRIQAASNPAPCTLLPWPSRGAEPPIRFVHYRRSSTMCVFSSACRVRKCSIRPNSLPTLAPRAFIAHIPLSMPTDEGVSRMQTSLRRYEILSQTTTTPAPVPCATCGSLTLPSFSGATATASCATVRCADLNIRLAHPRAIHSSPPLPHTTKPYKLRPDRAKHRVAGVGMMIESEHVVAVSNCAPGLAHAVHAGC
jgi:hypothetical protein